MKSVLFEFVYRPMLIAACFRLYIRYSAWEGVFAKCALVIHVSAGVIFSVAPENLVEITVIILDL